MSFVHHKGAFQYLMDFKVNNDKDESIKITHRVPLVFDCAETNIHKFFNSVRSKIDISDNDNNSQNGHHGNRQSNQLRLEMQYKYTNKVQIFNQKLEEIFNFPETEAKIIDTKKIKEKKNSKNRKNTDKRVHMNYADLHMNPEMMESVPENFLDNWIVVPCPEGQRTILVSHKGKTNMYSTAGVQIACFSSELPGGIEHNVCKEMLNKDYTVLDCIWLKSNKIIYILDVLCWCTEPLYHYEAEKRFLFLNHHIKHNTKLLRTIVEGRNDYSINGLPFQYSSNDISEFLKEITEINIDKLLFYHKNSLYLKGSTPLVLWLKPLMLPKVLGI